MDSRTAMNDAGKTPETPRWDRWKQAIIGATGQEPTQRAFGLLAGEIADLRDKERELNTKITHLEGALREAEAKAALVDRFRKILSDRIWVLESCESNMNFQDWLTAWRKDYDDALQQPKADA